MYAHPVKIICQCGLMTGCSGPEWKQPPSTAVLQVTELAASAEQLHRDKIRFEAEKEMEEESIVNRLQRQIESLLQNYKVLAAACTLAERICSVPPSHGAACRLWRPSWRQRA